MKMKIIIGCVVAAAAVGGGVMYFTNTPGGDAMMMAGVNTVVTSTVPRGDLRQVVTANGMVELERIEPIYSSAQGETRLRVAEVLVEVGDHVVEGQPIVTYDIEDALLDINRQIRQSEIELTNESLSLQARAVGPSPQEYINLRNAVFTAQEGIVSAEEDIIARQIAIDDASNDIANQRQAIETSRRAYEQAMVEVDVNSRILTLGGISRHAFDEIVQDAEDKRLALSNAEIDLNNLMQSLETSERALETAQRGLDTAHRGLADAQMNYMISAEPLSTESERIQHAQASNSFQLSRERHNVLLEERERLISQTVSHTSGMVTEVEVTVGAQVTGTSKLVEVADFSNLIVTAEIREVDAPQVFVGQSVTMTSAGLMGMVYTGTVSRVSPTATTRQAQMGTEIVVPIEISVDNPDEQLRPGFSVDIEIVLVESLDTASVSLMSILQDFETGQEYVLVIDETNILRRRDITRGITTALEIEVLEGLEGGERIILTPTPMMQDGDPLPEDAVDGGGFMGGAADGQAGGGGGMVIRGGGGGGGGVVIRTN